MNCCGTKHYDNNPCVPCEDIAPRDGLVVEKCDECDGYCYNMDDTEDCHSCGKLVLVDGSDHCFIDGLDFCDDCGKKYDQQEEEEEEEDWATKAWAHLKAVNTMDGKEQMEALEKLK